MIKAIATVALAAGVLAGVSGVSGVSGISGAGQAAAATRSPSFDVSTGTCHNEAGIWEIFPPPHYTPSADAYWTKNGCGWWLRVHVVCANPRLGLGDYLNSGWVHSLNLKTGRTCPKAGEIVTKLAIDWHRASSTTVHRVWVYP